MSFRLLEKQTIYKGVKLNLEVHRLEDEDGKQIKREIVVHNGAVVILPILKDGRILLIRQRRYALNQVLIELPAGTLERGEDPMNCAGRELQEETGHLAGRLVPIASFFPSPGILTEKMYAFAAYDLEETMSALEDGEDIEVLPVDFDHALEMIGEGQIADAKTIATLLIYDRFRRNKPDEVQRPMA